MSTIWRDDEPEPTTRGEHIQAWTIVAVLILAMWGASALGYLLTGVKG